MKKALITILKVLLVLLICAGLLYGYDYYTKISAEKEQEEIAQQEVTAQFYIYDEPELLAYGDDIFPDPNDYCNYMFGISDSRFLTEFNSKYIWIDGKLDVYGLSKEELSENMKTTANTLIAQYNDSNQKPFDDLDKLQKCAKTILYNMTKGYSTAGYKGQSVHYSYTTEYNQIDAFIGILEDGVNYCTADNSNINPIKAKGFSLDIDNIEVEKIISCRTTYNSAIIQMSADVTTKKRPYDFYAQDWIPEVNKTKRVTFLYTLNIYNSASHSSFGVGNIFIANHKDI